MGLLSQLQEVLLNLYVQLYDHILVMAVKFMIITIN